MNIKRIKNISHRKSTPSVESEKLWHRLHYHSLSTQGKDAHRLQNRNQYQKARKEFLELYGHKCICCGETAEEFLTLDHVKGIKGKRQSSYAAYRDACKKFPSNEYRVLCMNCNFAHGMYGYCPHQKEKENELH